jgi:hypothetical protein
MAIAGKVSSRLPEVEHLTRCDRLNWTSVEVRGYSGPVLKTTLPTREAVTVGTVGGETFGFRRVTLHTTRGTHTLSESVLRSDAASARVFREAVEEMRRREFSSWRRGLAEVESAQLD